MNDHDTVEAALREAVSRFGSRAQVTAIDIGPKFSNHRRVADTAIRLHVARKRPLQALGLDAFPSSIGGVPVDVLERQYEPTLVGAARQAKKPAGSGRAVPLAPGVSISHRLCPTGTLGLFVRDNRDRSMALLTNWHVLADSSFAKPGDPILQPSLMDQGEQPADVVARLSRTILDVDGDAGIARLTDERPVALPITGLDRVPRTVADPKPGDIVVKSGRSTGVTKGRVEGTGIYFPIYRTRDRVGIRGFEIVPLERGNPADLEISNNGDSGAAWLLDGTDTMVGLHFLGERAAAPESEVAIACFATRVFVRLDISLATPE